MMKLGDPFQNILTLAVLFGFGYLIYAKWKENRGGDNVIKGLFTKAGEVVNKTNLKGGGGQFGK